MNKREFVEIEMNILAYEDTVKLAVETSMETTWEYADDDWWY